MKDSIKLIKMRKKLFYKESKFSNKRTPDDSYVNLVLSKSVGVRTERIIHFITPDIANIDRRGHVRYKDRLCNNLLL